MATKIVAEKRDRDQHQVFKNNEGVPLYKQVYSSNSKIDINKFQLHI